MAMEEGIADMLHDFLFDDLPYEEASVLDKEAKNRHKRETEIKEQCNKMLYEGAKVSKVQVLLSLLNLQTIYGWLDVSVLALFQLLQKNPSRGKSYTRVTSSSKKDAYNAGVRLQEYTCLS